jgi:hypothetical protein
MTVLSCARLLFILVLLAFSFCINGFAQETSPTPPPTASPTPSPSPSPSQSPSPRRRLLPHLLLCLRLHRRHQPSASPRPAILKLRVEYELNGAKQSVGLKRFFLCARRFREVARFNSGSLTFRILRRHRRKPPLLAWLDANNCDFVYCREMQESDLQVPEFRKAYERG